MGLFFLPHSGVALGTCSSWLGSQCWGLHLRRRMTVTKSEDKGLEMAHGHNPRQETGDHAEPLGGLDQGAQGQGKRISGPRDCPGPSPGLGFPIAQRKQQEPLCGLRLVRLLRGSMGTPRVRQRPWELNQRVAMGAIELGWRRDPVGKSETGWAAARGQGGRTTCDKRSRLSWSVRGPGGSQSLE